MKLSLKWASDYVDLSKMPSLKDYSDKLTYIGQKVEGYETLGADIENVKVGKIVSIEKHPDSDHMVICQLDCGEDSLRQIVTGAQNVFEGALVPAAIPPAKLPGGVTIKDGKLRGVESHGMLCSIAELGLTTHDVPYAVEDGILIIEENCKPGDDIHDVYMLTDDVVEFEITSNRPDCLSVIGLARESAVCYGTKLIERTPKVNFTKGDKNINDYISVEISNKEKCPRYTARVVRNVKIAPSPLWMRMRLRAAGVRPINNIVDITNYVMLEYGHPMHAFDYSCLEGSHINVRDAADGEKFISLDNGEHILDKNTLVIADKKKAVALAGIMGGLNSEIKDDTKTVVFESACFEGSTVRISAKAQGMRTESSARFEKGLDAENTLPAIDRACELVELLGAGEVVEGTIDVYPGKKEPVRIPLEVKKINEFLGLNVDEAYMKNALETIGFKVENGIVTSPSFRIDIECMNDLAEEVLRIYGYDTIEATKFKAEVTPGKISDDYAFELLCHDTLISAGLYESVTFSFISPKNYDKIALPSDSVLRNSVVITNPLGEDTSVMRTTAVPSMLEVLARNCNYHDAGVSMYEMATIYLPDDNKENLPCEPRQIVIGKLKDGNFYDLKGVVDILLEKAGVAAEYIANTNNPTYHPGRCADLVAADGRVIGTLGEIHPKVLENFGISAPAYVADISFDTLFELSNTERSFKALPKYPAAVRDLAFVCDDALEVGAIEKVIKMADRKTIESVELFDVYKGHQLGDDKKSVAFKVSMRSADHTLTVEEADKILKKILTLLERELGITLRK
ncbi:MAG: phenylalanine--tRNA ligase subunit beta [Ruminococcaceae bacterium]|nr:phenylalanine--tRNA ligase subunit beta [Oscillospiraceae bacterium]